MDKSVFGIESGSSSKEKIQLEKRQRALAPTLEDIQGHPHLVLCVLGFASGLYLGPHIASVTMAAYQCNSLQFPSPPYPDDIICPAEPYGPLYRRYDWRHFFGVLESLWDSPLYLMARAAYLHGYDPDDAEDLVELEALNAEKDRKNLCLLDKCKLFVKRVAKSIKFFEILALATYR
ncbi:GL13661 [Drosophila persimilis]|uniref:GL13661 n=1 Tax=Drosophila persimilis TaxID=7234 RepID=B4GP75_DROPE|nr:GL13661 [Drosophila persimilis]